MVTNNVTTTKSANHGSSRTAVNTTQRCTVPLKQRKKCTNNLRSITLAGQKGRIFVRMKESEIQAVVDIDQNY